VILNEKVELISYGCVTSFYLFVYTPFKEINQSINAISYLKTMQRKLNRTNKTTILK